MFCFPGLERQTPAMLCQITPLHPLSEALLLPGFLSGLTRCGIVGSLARNHTQTAPPPHIIPSRQSARNALSTVSITNKSTQRKLVDDDHGIDAYQRYCTTLVSTDAGWAARNNNAKKRKEKTRQGWAGLGSVNTYSASASARSSSGSPACS